MHKLLFRVLIIYFHPVKRSYSSTVFIYRCGIKYIHRPYKATGFFSAQVFTVVEVGLLELQLRLRAAI